MGTNYYVVGLDDPDDGEGWHVGKQSAGWPWCWADPPEDTDIGERWRLFAVARPGLTVVDEYGRNCGPLLDFVCSEGREASGYHVPGNGWS